jgi:hypothetical protein
MSRVSATFRQIDVTRVLRAARAAGIEVTRIEVDPSGRIIVMTSVGAAPEPTGDLDKWLATHAAH